jgi:MYXO-CTERM domain-containing protein
MLRRSWLAAAVAAASALVGPTRADVVFNFSTGNPDGLIATASRPGPDSGANQETESGDDFKLPARVRLDQATFTGLLPSGVNPLTNIAQVRVEIYRVFPLDSDVGRTSGPPDFSTPQVPTRVNSPADVELVDRDSAAGNLTFLATQIAPTFTAKNSVDLGIHPQPNQFTGGDGSVTRQEVQFSVAFTTPLTLDPGHYFFVPQVLLSNPDDHFLWLSAPKPIVSPGTPFTPDLQSWIRNAQLDPDWLRIGTDITHQGPFNASFALTGQVVPEPSTLATAGLGALALCGAAWRRRRVTAS